MIIQTKKIYLPDEEYGYMTLGDVVNICTMYPEFTVEFSDGRGVGRLMSWRGSYKIPSLEFSDEISTGREVAQNLIEDLEKTHYGYKGGEYRYYRSDEFYVSSYGSWSNQEKVSEFQVSEQDQKIVLFLELVEYHV